MAIKMKVWNGISYCMEGATVYATMQQNHDGWVENL